MLLFRMSYQFDRAYYRLVYPIALRPTLVVGAERIPVVDLSEQGIRLLYPALPSGTPMAGTLEISTGESIAVEGKVVRIDPPVVGLYLSRGVPFSLMMEQQRYLQKRVVSWR